MKIYLGVGVVFQVPDQTGAEVADIGLNFPYIIAEGIQLGQHDLVTVGAAVGLPARQCPNDRDDQSAQRADRPQDGINDGRVHYNSRSNRRSIFVSSVVNALAGSANLASNNSNNSAFSASSVASSFKTGDGSKASPGTY